MSDDLQDGVSGPGRASLRGVVANAVFDAARHPTGGLFQGDWTLHDRRQRETDVVGTTITFTLSSPFLQVSMGSRFPSVRHLDAGTRTRQGVSVVWDTHWGTK